MNRSLIIKGTAVLLAAALALIIQGCSLALPEDSAKDEFATQWEEGILWGVWLQLENLVSDEFDPQGWKQEAAAVFAFEPDMIYLDSSSDTAYVVTNFCNVNMLYNLRTVITAKDGNAFFEASATVYIAPQFSQEYDGNGTRINGRKDTVKTSQLRKKSDGSIVAIQPGVGINLSACDSTSLSRDLNIKMASTGTPYTYGVTFNIDLVRVDLLESAEVCFLNSSQDVISREGIDDFSEYLSRNGNFNYDDEYIPFTLSAPHETASVLIIEHRLDFSGKIYDEIVSYSEKDIGRLTDEPVIRHQLVVPCEDEYFAKAGIIEIVFER